MSIARHHAEWLSLVEASGPFLSLPVLLKAFPAGLDAHEPEQLKLLRSAYEEWQDNQFGLKPEPAIHRAWVEFVLKQTLELPEDVLRSGQQLPPGLSVAVAEQNETLRPDWVVVNPAGTADGGKPRMLVQLVPSGQALEKPLKGSRWAASPATRMMELLHACNVRLGLVTNGEHWMLVNAPKGETTGFISWYSILWVEEHLTLRAFRSLLVARRFFGVEDSQTLEALLSQSVADQQEVTDQLGYQVRRAVEVLVQAIARLDQDQNGALLKDIAESQIYEAALTVMMRLVFLFCAEDRGLLLLGDPMYDQHYAVSTLREQLRSHADLHGEEVLERRSDAWCRLLATFRAVYGGIFHDTLQLPAYGGSLFDPDRFPFLEGRGQGTHWQEASADPLRINNRIVLHLLEALQILQIRVPGGGVEPRRLSFRALDIEQIGHVYEGLLDHTAVRATSTVLGLVGTRYEEPEVALAALERFQAQGEEALLAWLKEQTGRSLSALKKALGAELEPRDQQRLRTACNNDSALFDRVLPFAGLIRQDTLGYPVVISAGAVYMTEGVDRRQSGTHYTPRNLTEEIVQYTLEPLVYEGVAEGKPKEEWRLRSAAALLQLKICDMAMGSGAFLVQTCRYLAGKLVEAWQQAEAEHPGQVVIAPEGTLSGARPEECPIPKDADERLAVARRIVADRCLYGVDKNPLAVEMAKLSLWLVTLAKGRPFTFVDHALKWGDSLLGITRPEQIEFLKLNPEKEAVQLRTVSDRWKPFVQRAIAKRQELENFSVSDIADIQKKKQLNREAEAAIAHVRHVGDFLVAEALAQVGKTSDLTDEEIQVLAEVVIEALDEPDAEKRNREIAAILAKTERMMNLGNPERQRRKPFHWLLEFPEVFLQEDSAKGFSAIVGNPPFLGGSMITGILGTEYRDLLVESIAYGKRGRSDLSAYFFLRSYSLLSAGSTFGLIATNTIAQGDTREVGLEQLAVQGGVIFRAVPSRKWIGTASLEVAHIWIYKGNWSTTAVLEEVVVPSITPYLTVPSKASGKPYRLYRNAGISFEGSKPTGMGFVLEPEEAYALIKKNPKNKDVLFPYLNAEDLNSHPEQSPSRWIINFFDWALNPEQDDPKNPKGEPYVSSYPDCLKITEEKVKPERTRRNEKGDFVLRKPLPEKWWIYGEKRPALYSTIKSMEKVLIIPRVSKFLNISFSKSDLVINDRITVIALEEFANFATLQASIHQTWTLVYQTTLETRGLYTPSDCLETFPFPTPDPSDLSTQFPTLNTIGETYYTHRQAVMRERQEGLTKTYNRFHNASEMADDIQTLRELHVEMDQAVAAAYGWQDLDLGHGFHQTKQGDRFTISETARQEVLDRLLELNHQRYAEEVAHGLHDKKGKSKSTKGKSSKKQQSNTEFGNDQLSLL
ncbi:restriction endonuclease [Phormidium sp. FACHB-592]|uniref:site-specific DNA-methyltransferase (adenine-specific) n=1 Tax=Stenomitos frigidus AS-A4 TaxID=2933935 RepID=A0ABV0KKE4_9CYAN|nr:type IIL restriction-modification enzyme MmeI [Phormidium sp. FACHB-592]MBD2076988.1 restriction endonuclease [Phormidium sp. FACHB-592]